jgi:hypothetical protein
LAGHHQQVVDHAVHRPITVVLDVKDDLTHNDEGSDLEDSNQSLQFSSLPSERRCDDRY